MIYHNAKTKQIYIDVGNRIITIPAESFSDIEIAYVKESTLVKTIIETIEELNK